MLSDLVHARPRRSRPMDALQRRSVPALLVCLFALAGCVAGDDAEVLPPNVIVILADDLGYGDLAGYGHPSIRTPHIDRMADEGVRLTQFYSAASVCTPSRAALLTGRLPIRSGMAGDGRRVLYPDSKLGLPPEEITIAEFLRERGYASAAIGKWHLGHRAPFLPTSQGFDSYFGIPYSNDMDLAGDVPHEERFGEPRIEYFNVPLMRDERVVERPADQRTLTRRYTEESLAFIRENRQRPFFVYLAHSLPHVPLFRSDAFAGRSARGLYGDVVEEIDWSVGEILKGLRELGIAERTLVVFTSDNGPWLTYGVQGGSAGLLRGGKGMTWEGGMREPAVFWWPGTLPAGRTESFLASTLDILPTVLAAAGGSAPPGLILDGDDLVAALQGESPLGDRVFYYYRGTKLYAIRRGPWKAHFITEWAYRENTERTVHDPPLLFNVEQDPSENHDLAERHPDILSELVSAAERHLAETPPAPSRLGGSWILKPASRESRP